MTFTLKIQLGNDAMRSGADVAAALERIARMIADTDRPVGAGIVRDLNGNRVGVWAISEEGQ